MAQTATAPRALVLNADFRPLSTCPLSVLSAQDAIKAVFRDRATVVDEWPQVFRSPSIEIRIPKVIALREYAPVSVEPTFCRRTIYLRDRFCCQYCGQRFEASCLTFDHVIPRRAGGQTVWENILTACSPCNAAKRDSMPNFSGRRGKRCASGMRPLKTPRRPTTAELLRAGLECLDDELKADYGSWLYWSVELEA